MNKKSLTNSNQAKYGISLILVFILLFPLFSLPQLGTFPGHPWKVEFLSTLFLIAALIWSYFKSDKTDLFRSGFDNSQTKKILILFICFTVLSGISVIWANSPRSVAHHTFLWLVYILFFIGSLRHLRDDKSYRSVIFIFVLISLIIFITSFFDYLAFSGSYHSIGTIRIRYGKFAELLVTLLPVLWGLALTVKNKRLAILYLAAGSLAWLTVMLSLSKGVFIAGLAGFMLFFTGTVFFSKTRFCRRAVLLAIFWLAVTVVTQGYFSISTAMPSTTDYISGKADATRSTSDFRIFTWKITRQMIADNPLTGVGADNFGAEVNTARKRYALINLQDPQNALAEDYLIERSHNEFLQIFAELGILGFLILLSVAGVFMIWITKSFVINKYKFSPVLFGSLAGIMAFCVSSSFSSFSFRAAQNGIVFFLVLAVLTRELSKINANTIEEEKSSVREKWKNPMLAFSILLVFCGANLFAGQGLSNYYVTLGQQEKDLHISEQLFHKASFFNHENALASLSNGYKLFSKKRYREAIPYFRKTIDLGVGITLVYHYLARSQELSGDKLAAEKTLREALEIFPRSIYARTHYAVLLKQTGKTEKALIELDFAKRLDAKQTNSWLIILRESVLATTLQSQKNDDVIAPDKLKPANVVLAIYNYELAGKEERKNKVSKK